MTFDTKPQPSGNPAPSIDGGSAHAAEGGGTLFLLIFLAATLAISLAIVAVALVDSWWMLGGVMLFDIVVTSGVTAMIARLLNDDATPG